MNKGFTMVEMLVVIIIASILLMLAIPYYQSFRADNKASDLATAIASALHFAKSEAIRQNTVMTLCGANATQTACNNNNSWDNGWIIIGPNNDIHLVYAASIPNTLTATPNNTVQFQASGFLSSVTNNSFTIQPADCKTGYTVTVSNSGAVSTTKFNCP